MKKKIIILIFLIMIPYLWGKKVGLLKDVLVPQMMEVTEERLYVVEKANFFVYSLADLKFIGKFGKEGSGPGETKVVPFFPNRLMAFPDKIFIDSLDKVIYFTPDFKMIQEKVKNPNIIEVVPLKNGYVAKISEPDIKKQMVFTTITLLDTQFKKIRELGRQEIAQRAQRLVMIPDLLYFSVYEDKIFLEKSPDGFIVDVYNEKGDRLYQIKKEIAAVPVKPEDKENILTIFKNDPLVAMQIRNQGGWENYKKLLNFVYPDFFPKIKDIIVANDRIYSFTNEKKDNLQKLLIMDLQGKTVGESFLPIPVQPSILAQVLGKDEKFYDIRNNKFYYIKPNEDDEWELFVEPIIVKPVSQR